MPKSAPRVPPPCWTEQETRALIAAYRDRWFSANRGSLRAADWAAIASSVAAASGTPQKTAVQCQHKVEKLRRRYREEKKKLAGSDGRWSSSWELFPLLDAMEIGSFGSNAKDDGHGVRFNERSSDGGCKGDLNHFLERGKKGDGRPVARTDDRAGVGSIVEIARAIMASAESFVKVEEMKMEVATAIERMRMEMDLQRDQMMLELQVNVLNSIANRLGDLDDSDKTTDSKQKKKRQFIPMVSGDLRLKEGHLAVSSGNGISNWGKRGKRG